MSPSEKEPIATNRLLLLCARGQFDVEAHTTAANLLRTGIDWDRLFRTAGRNYLPPLLFKRLQDPGTQLVPSSAMIRFRSAYYANLLRYERLDDELEEVVGSLWARGVETIVLKGSALARTVYDDPALRPMADLDLMVPSEQVERAGCLLNGLGFDLAHNQSAFCPFGRTSGAYIGRA